MSETGSSSMSAAAAQYRESLHKYQPRGGTNPPENGSSEPNSTNEGVATEPTDTDMTMADGEPDSSAPEQTQPEALTSQTANAVTSAPSPSPVPGPISSGATPQPHAPPPARTSTPSRLANGHAERSSPAPSSPAPTAPSKAVPHGAPARRYLNENVTGALLDGMKKLAKEQPKDPLKVLGEFLLAKSKEMEGNKDR